MNLCSMQILDCLYLSDSVSFLFIWFRFVSFLFVLDTPHYIASSEAAHRVFDMFGKDSGLKFIVTLREPASRAISSWEFKNEYNAKKGRKYRSDCL